MAATPVIVEPGLRDAVIALATAAARDILGVYGGVFDVVRKADASPLTEADLASHRRILDGLAHLTPGIPVLSEESADTIPAGTRRGWTRYWLVDPLDGTREFVKRNGEFTVNIALVDEGVPVFGVIQQPTTSITWWGQRGEGAWRLEAGAAAHRIHVDRPARAPLRVALSRSHVDGATQAMVQRIGEVEAVNRGSSLKFCLLAEGALDVYPRFGPTSEWDTAAGQAILEAAGGAVLDFDGAPLSCNQRDGLLNGAFIALGDPALPWRDWR